VKTIRKASNGGEEESHEEIKRAQKSVELVAKTTIRKMVMTVMHSTRVGGVS